MIRQVRSAARLAAALLLVGLAATACGRPGAEASGQPAGRASGAESSPVATATPAASAALTQLPTTTPDASGSPAPSAGVPGKSAAPAATTDPIDTDLQLIDQILNGMGGSLSGADAGSNGGE